MAKHRGLALAFINLEKAFDKVPCTQLMEMLLCECGLDPSIVEFIRCMYQDAVGQVVGDSSTFGMTSGVKQGYPALPLLFSIFFDCVASFLATRLPAGHPL